MHTFVGHKAQVNTLALADNTMFVASGSRDGTVNIWNLVEGRHLDEIDAESPVNVLLFANKLYWLLIGTEKGLRVYDLPHRKFVDDHRYELDRKKDTWHGCISLAWSKTQVFLYTGWTDGLIRVFKVTGEKIMQE